MNAPLNIVQLEVNIVNHCNLKCKGCNHASPINPKYYVDPESVRTDLKNLKPFLRAKKIRLMGGEPLLHPQIDTILDICHEIGIAGSIETNTNGVNLNNMSSHFWSRVHFVWLSHYPGIKLDFPQRYKGKIGINKMNEFRYPYSVFANDDIDQINQIWSTCRIRDYAFGLVDGYLFRCIRASYIANYLHTYDPTIDGIEIASLTMEKLLAHAHRQAPLRGCANCTGSCGKTFPHEQKPRNWTEDTTRPIKEILDPDLLNMLPSTLPR